MNKHSQTKDAKYYLGLSYPVTHRALREDEGGGFAAYINELGPNTFFAVGETLREALDNLEERRKRLIPELIAKGIVLPEPSEDEECDYSGSMMLRVPRTLHAALVRRAKTEGVSLNKLATQYLAEGNTRQLVLAETRLALEKLITSMTHEPTVQFGTYSVIELGRTVSAKGILQTHEYNSWRPAGNQAYEKAS